MPMYEFTKDSGEVVPMMLSFADFDKRVKNGKITLDDGEIASYSWDQHKLNSSYPSTYPMVSYSCGVHPAQVREHTEHLRAMGCGFVEHTKNGDVVFNDKAQRKKVCEALGMFDRNAGPSDPTPKYRTANVRKYR
jgi:hypothetical protein